MCCVDGKDSKLVVVVFIDGKLCAFNMLSSKLQWEAKQEIADSQQPLKAGGVTTDGRGNLFVSDLVNKWVQRFSLNGEYLGGVVSIHNKEEPDVVYPISHIRWLNKYSSLIVVGELLNKRYYVHFYKWNLH